jgi:hypothetical protein
MSCNKKHGRRKATDMHLRQPRHSDSESLYNHSSEWFYKDSESHIKAQCSNCGKEAFLKYEIKDLGIYISSLHEETEILHNQQDLLQQRVFSYLALERNYWCNL